METSYHRAAGRSGRSFGWSKTCISEHHHKGHYVRVHTHTYTHTNETTIIHLLEKAGDVVFAAGRPGERVGIGCYVGSHQFGGLMAFGTAGVSNPIMVHPKTKAHNRMDISFFLSFFVFTCYKIQESFFLSFFIYFFAEK